MTLEPGPPEVEPRSTAVIARALAAYGLSLAAEPEPVAESVLNENYHVLTDDGPRFLRFVRPSRNKERLLLEQRLVTWAEAQGLPVVRAELAGGRLPYARAAGDLVQVYPWIEGRHAGPSAADAAALGEVQARIHLALEGFSDAELRHGGSGASWDTEQAIQVLSRVDDLIRYYPAPPAESLRIQESLRFQLQLLESSEALPTAHFSSLRSQPCHGDYHSRNVLLGVSGDVAAVLDWELASVIPPVYEILRAISYSGYLVAPLLEAYLGAYARVRALSAEECDLGVEMWWQSRLHDTWVYEMRLIRGDRRVERFFAVEDALLRRFSDGPYRHSLAAALRELAAR